MGCHYSRRAREEITMPKLAWIVMLAALAAAPAAAQTAVPDLRGTWKGESETVVLGRGNEHHAGPRSTEPRLSSVPFTMVIDKQDGRRISGTFSSAKHSEKVLAVIGRSGAIYLVDDDGYSVGTMVAPDRIDLCYLARTAATRIASCTELTKQP
jgi:hypothetical protein